MLLAIEFPPELLIEIEHLNLGFVANTQGTALEVKPTLELDVRRGQKMDEKIQEFARLIKEDKAPGFHLDQDGTVWFKHQICVPDIQHIKNVILSEVHESAYSIHPGSTKMYQELKEILVVRYEEGYSRVRGTV